MSGIDNYTKFVLKIINGVPTNLITGIPLFGSPKPKFNKNQFFSLNDNIYIDTENEKSSEWIDSNHNFTIDWWMCIYRYRTSGNDNNVIIRMNSFQYIEYYSGYYNRIVASKNGGVWNYGNSGGYPALFFDYFEPAEWHHLAFCQDESYGYTFVDGKHISTASHEGTSNISFTGFVIGSDELYEPHYFIEDLRISNCCRWKEDFTPPTESYTINTVYTANDNAYNIID